MASTQNTNQKVKLTKSVVDRTPFPDAGQSFLRDSLLNGFALRLTPGSKSFILEKRIHGKVKRVTLGRYPDITVEQARNEAHKWLGQIATGENPIANKNRAQMKGTTLGEAFEAFLSARKSLKPKTIYDYRRMMETIFADWKSKPISGLTKEMVVRRHTEVGENRGEASANLALRFLRSLLNFAMEQYETLDGDPLIRDNPVARLTRTRAWYRVERRQTVIKPHQLPAWHQAVLALKEDGKSPQSDTIADYLLCLLFTGLRRQEAAQLEWSRVDLKHRTLTIQDTKNREPLTLPLSDFLMGLFEARKAVATSRYVFPGEGKAGYLVEPRKQMANVMIESGVKFTIHDLRRTFITVAESLDISAYALKRLVNHKMSGDVTAGYIVADVERLREPMQRISDYLIRTIGKKPTAPV